MTKQEVINAFTKGKRVRITSGIWNVPKRDGVIAKSVEGIEKVYSWAQAVEVKEDESGIIDLIGASYCDMF